MVRLVCFDTETSELLSDETKDTCKIVQLSWIMYDTITHEQIDNDYILNIDKEITNSHIHKITTEMSQKGYYFSDIFEIFLDDIIDCDLIVGHNLNYDLNAVEVELYHIEEFEAILLALKEALPKNQSQISVEQGFDKPKGWMGFNDKSV